MALSFAWDGVRDGIASEIRGIVDPVMLKLMINTAFAAYMGLLILPEPVAQGRLVLEAPFAGGQVLLRGAATPVAGAGVRIVLEGTGGGAWRIVTAFPIP